MIHVSVRHEDRVKRGQFFDRKRRLDQTARADCDARKADADARAQGRVCQQPRAVEVDKNSRMSQPGYGQVFVAPAERLGAIRGRGDCGERFLRPLIKKTAAILAGEFGVYLQVFETHINMMP